MPGLVCRLAADALGLTDRQEVALWADMSGSGGDAGQADASERPAYRSDILNGRPAVRFDGDDTLAFSGAGLDLARHVPGLTVFLVARPGSTYAMAEANLLALATGSGVTRFLTGFSYGALRLGGRRLDADAFQAVSGGSYTADGPVLLTAQLDYQGAAAALWADGAQVAAGVFRRPASRRTRAPPSGRWDRRRAAPPSSRAISPRC